MRKECPLFGIIPDRCSSQDVSCDDENIGADETNEAASNKDKHPKGSSCVRYCIVILLRVAFLGLMIIQSQLRYGT